MAGFEISVVTSDEDLQRYCDFEARVDPDNAHDLDELRERRQRSASQLTMLAEQDGEVVGLAGCGDPPGTPRTFCWARIHVLDTARRQGIGQAFLDRISAHTLGLGKRDLESWVDSTEAEGVAFALARGLREVGRIRELELDLTGPLPELAPPDGVQVAPYSELEGVEQGMYEVALEAVPDMPAPEP